MATETTAKKTSAKKAASAAPRIAYYLSAKITFISPLLATNANDPQIYSEYLASLANDETRAAEIERLGLAEVDEKGMTVFLRNPDNPMQPQLKGYTWLGFLKSRSRALAKVDGTQIKGMSAYIKEIDDRIFVSPIFINLDLPEGEAIDTLQRPLRAATMQGDRVALAKSETVPEGTTCEVTFRTETLDGMKLVIECLDYGKIHGTGQWRNAGYGRFTWEKIDQWKEYIDKVKLEEDDFPMR
jgi:hypothetical protein